jgi:hypothetical protein
LSWLKSTVKENLKTFNDRRIASCTKIIIHTIVYINTLNDMGCTE